MRPEEFNALFSRAGLGERDCARVHPLADFVVIEIGSSFCVELV